MVAGSLLLFKGERCGARAALLPVAVAPVAALVFVGLVLLAGGGVLAVVAGVALGIGRGGRCLRRRRRRDLVLVVALAGVALVGGSGWGRVRGFRRFAMDLRGLHWFRLCSAGGT